MIQLLRSRKSLLEVAQRCQASYENAAVRLLREPVRQPPFDALLLFASGLGGMQHHHTVGRYLFRIAVAPSALTNVQRLRDALLPSQELRQQQDGFGLSGTRQV